MRKSIGPRIDPCGTPQVSDFWDDLILYISMYCFQYLAVWQSNGSCMGCEYNSDEVVHKSAEFVKVLMPTRPF